MAYESDDYLSRHFQTSGIDVGLKVDELVGLSVPPGSPNQALYHEMLMTVVRKPDGEGHAVLTVRTDKGDFILDNLTDQVRTWDQTGYRFLKRQASDNTGRWVSIREGQQLLVGSVQ